MSLKLKLIKNAFYLRIISYPISNDRTIKERNSYEALFNQKNELKKIRNVGRIGVQNLRLSLGSKNCENQEETILTKSTENLKKLLIFYTNSDNMINKRNEIQSLVLTNNLSIFCIIKSLTKKRFTENWRMRDSNRLLLLKYLWLLLKYQ